MYYLDTRIFIYFNEGKVLLTKSSAVVNCRSQSSINFISLMNVLHATTVSGIASAKSELSEGAVLV